MTKGKNESKILTKDICECKCKFDRKKNVIQIKNRIMTNVDLSTQNIHVKKNAFGILVHVFAKMEDIDESVITCDGIIGETKS